MVYALILGGGSGTRLWPYSRNERPKQFLSISGGRSMLQETVDRTLPIIPPDRVYIATGEAYAELVAEQLPDVPRANILLEPTGRGTAACIGLAALHLRRRDPNAVMVVMSVDHRVERADLFCATLMFGAQLAQQNKLVMLGIQPTTPSTSHGYMQRGELYQESEALQAYRVAAFVEKPDAHRATTYVASGQYTGMFVWRADRILAEISQHRPALMQGLALIDTALDTPDAAMVLPRVWPTLESVAIDVAVLEQTSHAVVIPCDAGWSDVGDWAGLAEALPRDCDGNAVVGQHIGVQTSNSLIYGDGRIVATIGLEDLLIIDTHDVLLICPRSRAQDVKMMVARIREQYQHLL